MALIPSTRRSLFSRSFLLLRASAPQEQRFPCWTPGMPRTSTWTRSRGSPSGLFDIMSTRGPSKRFFPWYHGLLAVLSEMKRFEFEPSGRGRLRFFLDFSIALSMLVLAPQAINRVGNDRRCSRSMGRPPQRGWPRGSMGCARKWDLEAGVGTRPMAAAMYDCRWLAYQWYAVLHTSLHVAAVLSGGPFWWSFLTVISRGPFLKGPLWGRLCFLDI